MKEKKTGFVSDVKKNKQLRSAFPSSQNNASKLLLAIMESRHDSENAERILYNMRPKELVRTLFLDIVKCFQDSASPLAVEYTLNKCDGKKNVMIMNVKECSYRC